MTKNVFIEPNQPMHTDRTSLQHNAQKNRKRSTQLQKHFLQVYPETAGHSLPGLRWDSVITAWMEDLSRLKELRGESRPVM